jgi:hypothetical protein
MSENCFVCGNESKYVCKNCGLDYCSVICQKKDWTQQYNSHKEICGIMSAFIGGKADEKTEEEKEEEEKRRRRGIDIVKNLIHRHPSAAAWLLKTKISLTELLGLAIKDKEIYRFSLRKNVFVGRFTDVEEVYSIFENLEKEDQQQKIFHLVRYVKFSEFIVWAAKSGHKITLEATLKQKIPGQVITMALNEAILSDQIESIRVLVKDNRWDPEQIKIDGYVVQNSANLKEILQLLMSNGEFDATSVLKHAVFRQKPQIVRVLLDNERVDPTVENNEALISAIEIGDIEIFKMLLNDKRVDPSANRNYALRTAAYEGEDEIVMLLLMDRRTDPTDANNDAWQAAVEGNKFTVVDLLLQDGRVDPTVGHNWALDYADTQGYADLFELLIEDERVQQFEIRRETTI